MFLSQIILRQQLLDYFVDKLVGENGVLTEVEW